MSGPGTMYRRAISVPIPRMKASTARKQLSLELLSETAQQRDELGFAPHVMTNAFLPYRDKRDESLQGGVYVHSRKNGRIRVTITTPEEVGGLPFGNLPRLMITWLATQAVKTKSREIELGASLAGFLKELGMASSGGPNGSITRFKMQMNRLFSSSISSVEVDTEMGKLEKQTLDVVDVGQLWWDPKNPGDATKWQASIRLGETFFQSIMERPVPIDLGAIRAIKTSPMAIDIYCWLTYRMFSLKRRTEIPWGSLYAQFGGEYARERKFREVFTKQLGKVCAIYSDANVEPVRGGIVLRPSRSHVRSSNT